MTTDQVVVYSGNDGTPETYNTVTVDRGDGPGQEQIVQAVALPAVTTGTLTNDEDTVKTPAGPYGAAAVSFADGGGYVNDGETVQFQVSVDGVQWAIADFYTRHDDAGWAIDPSDGIDLNGLVVSAAVVVVPLNGAAFVRVYLNGQPAAGAVDVTITAGPAPVYLPTSEVAQKDPLVPWTVQVVGTADVSVDGQANVVDVGVTEADTIAGDGEFCAQSFAGRVAIQLDGNLDATITLEASLDFANWHPVDSSLLVDLTTGTGSALTGNGIWLVTFDAFCYLRIAVSGYNSGSSTATIYGASA